MISLDIIVGKPNHTLLVKIFQTNLIKFKMWENKNVKIWIWNFLNVNVEFVENVKCKC